MNEWASTEVAALQASWLLSLRARNLAAKTLRTYGDALAGLVTHSRAAALDDLTRHAVRAYLADQGARHKAATVSVRFRALQQFFKWLQEEGEVTASPMQGLRAPVVPEEPVPVLTGHEVGALLDACSGSGFAARRDKAMLSLFLDTGMRLSELAGLQVSDIDLTQQAALVLGKGRRPRACYFGTQTALALTRYLRVRARHTNARAAALWIGERTAGALTPNGVAQVVRRRGREAGVAGLHPHSFRHYFAHTYLVAGGQESDLMRLAGWKDRDMLLRYAASTATERARRAYALLSPMDALAASGR